MAHPSSSLEQQQAEIVLRDRLAARLGVPLTPDTLTLPGSSRIEVDGVSPDKRFLVEMWAHLGTLRGAQPAKVARDVLKLVTARQVVPDATLVLAFADEVAARCVTGRSWLAEAVTTFGIRIEVVEIGDELRTALLTAQARQRMVNPPVADEDGQCRTSWLGSGCLCGSAIRRRARWLSA